MTYSVGVVNAAIYCRLSKDDGTDEESCSIQNQKSTLIEYVQKQGWNIYDIYIDDGYTGTNFNRPHFQRMINDIENKRVNLVITKDLSRLGRNYIQTGMYTEDYFPSKNVRYIALNDDFDTDNDDNEFAPFKNIINEWYPKDISKKIRFTLGSKAKNGDCMNTVFPIYGYKYNENFERVPDEMTAPIVKMIFEEYVKTKSTQQVINMLKEKRIVCPKYYAYLTTNYSEEKVGAYTEEQKYTWSRTTIKTMIKKIEYLVHYVKGRYKTRSYKDRKVKVQKYGDSYIFENKFEPIISEELFNQANAIMKDIRELKSPKGDNIYRNIVVCENCLHPLTIQLRNDRVKGDRLYCRSKKCHNHSAVPLEVINEVIVNEVLSLKKIILNNEDKFIEFAKDYSVKVKQNNEVKEDKHEQETIKKLENRYKQLALFIQKLFESKVTNEINSENYDLMMKEYLAEQQTITEQLSIYKKEKQKVKEINYYNDALTLVKYLKELDENNILTFDVIRIFFKQIRVQTIRDASCKTVDIKFYITYNYLDGMTKEFINYESSKQ